MQNAFPVLFVLVRPVTLMFITIRNFQVLIFKREGSGREEKEQVCQTKRINYYINRRAGFKFTSTCPAHVINFNSCITRLDPEISVPFIYHSDPSVRFNLFSLLSGLKITLYEIWGN